jgi:GNAT superfamily N-acetyltransferase
VTEVRPARPEEFALLGAIETESGERFEQIGLHLGADLPIAERGEIPLAVYVAGDPPVGFVWMNLVDGRPHVEQISVLTAAGRQGVGRSLLEAACSWAQAAGYPGVTLCTFRDVAWNGPFYRSAGFVELEAGEWGPDVAALRRAERANGLDDLGARVVMLRRLHPPRTTGSTR